MPRAFYSSSDDELSTGAANLIAVVGPVPVTYGTTAGAITSYTTLSNNYTSLLVIVREPATRTSTKVTEKNAARKLLRDASVNFSRIFRSTATVTNAMLQGLNMPERVVPQPVPAPSSAPAMFVESVNKCNIKIRLRDAEDPDRRGKPVGCVGAAIFTHIGPTAPDKIAGWTFMGNSSSVIAEVELPSSTPPGSLVWLTSFWFNNRKESSPMATAISTNLPGGGISMAA